MSHDDEQLLQQFQANLLRARQLNAERAAEESAHRFDAVISPEKDEQTARRIADVYQQRIAAEKDLCQRAPRLAAFWGIAPATCHDLEQTLTQHPDILVLHYFVCQERLLIFLTRADGTRASHANISKQDLTRQVRLYRQLIEMQGRWDLSSLAELAPTDILLHDIARRLYDMLIAPVESLIPAGTRLCIVPHGVLHYLPFNTLRTNSGSYLIEKYELLYSVSHSIFDWCYNQSVDRTNQSVVAFANPALPTRRMDLPMAEEQSRNLATNHPDVQLFAGAEATKDAFWQYAPAAGILALDLHNTFDKSRPLATALRFAPSKGDSGSLTVREIYQRGKGALRGRLAVAAVCDGNVGEDVGLGAEDDLTTLARALHYAGFATVITSLWRVHDLSAWLLMEAFYDELLPPTDKRGWLAAGEALRGAQRRVARLSGRQVLERCLQQRERARTEDPHGLRAAWLELSAIAWVEMHCGNVAAAQAAYERARAVFASATDDYDETLDAIDHDLPKLNRLRHCQLQAPDYDQPIFAHPYYWGAFVLLGRWSC